MIEKLRYEDLAEHYAETYGPTWSDNELLVDQLDEELHHQHNCADYINSGEAVFFRAARNNARIHRNRKQTQEQAAPAPEAVVVE